MALEPVRIQPPKHNLGWTSQRLCPLWRSWGDPHQGRLVWQSHKMAPPGTQTATAAETVAHLLHGLFSRSSADLLGTSGYIFQNSCVCVLAKHCVLWTFQGKDAIKTNGKLFKASGFSSPKGSPGNMEGSVCIIFTTWTSLPRLLKKSHKKHLWFWVPR